jgi:hypothetical protein
MRVFGIILSIWIFLLAIGFIVCGIYVTNSGLCPTDVVNKVIRYLAR